jgi:hypothetical protein
VGWLLGAGLLALLALGGGSSSRRVRTGPSSRAPRGRVEQGDVQTTAELQASRLGIGVDLWHDLREWSYGPARRRDPYRSITGPVPRIEAWLTYIRDRGVNGESEALEAEARRMDNEGAHLAAEYARLRT